MDADASGDDGDGPGRLSPHREGQRAAPNDPLGWDNVAHRHLRHDLLLAGHVDPSAHRAYDDNTQPASLGPEPPSQWVSAALFTE
jgi:hypothetical protein